jgi:hypothetical protein
MIRRADGYHKIIKYQPDQEILYYLHTHVKIALHTDTPPV